MICQEEREKQPLSSQTDNLNPLLANAGELCSAVLLLRVINCLCKWNLQSLSKFYFLTETVMVAKQPKRNHSKMCDVTHR